MFDQLRVPLLVAPMAGGVTTPELVAAATEAGASGFLAAGYLGVDALGEQIRRTRELTGGRFGVNVFVPGERNPVSTEGYQRRLEPESARYGVASGPARWDDDAYPAKIDLLVAQRVSMVSFTFGVPARADVGRLHEVGTAVMVTVTNPEEARTAVGVGADALCVQGFEAGGHRAIFTDDGRDDAGGETYGLLAALRLIAAEVDLPLVATGGLVHGADIAAVLAAGARAAQLGTAFLRADEAATSKPQRDALADASRPTAFTRAFSGKPARGIVNRFLREHSVDAPAAYPQVHHLTKPIRAAAKEAEDAEAMNLWAGQTYPVAPSGPAADIIATLGAQARDALDRTRRLLDRDR